MKRRFFLSAEAVMLYLVFALLIVYAGDRTWMFGRAPFSPSTFVFAIVVCVVCFTMEAFAFSVCLFRKSRRRYGIRWLMWATAAGALFFQIYASRMAFSEHHASCVAKMEQKRLEQFDCSYPRDSVWWIGQIGIRREPLSIKVQPKYPIPDLPAARIGGPPVVDSIRAKFGNADLELIETFYQLQHLNLAKSNVGDAGMVHLQNSRLLRTLDLSNNNVSDDCIPHLRVLSHLLELNLSNTNVGQAGLVGLRYLPTLETLKLRNTQMDDEIGKTKGPSKLLFARCAIEPRGR